MNKNPFYHFYGDPSGSDTLVTFGGAAYRFVDSTTPIGSEIIGMPECLIAASYDWLQDEWIVTTPCALIALYAPCRFSPESYERGLSILIADNYAGHNCPCGLSTTIWYLGSGGYWRVRYSGTKVTYHPYA